MDTRTFKHRYIDCSKPRQRWIIKMLMLELDKSERQIERYFDADIGELKGKTKEAIEKVLSFSENTLDYRTLEKIESLPIQKEIHSPQLDNVLA